MTRSGVVPTTTIIIIINEDIFAQKTPPFPLGFFSRA
jgi:hypothetical protein